MSTYFIKQKDVYSEIEVHEANGCLKIVRNGRTFQVEISSLEDGKYSVLLNNKSIVVDATFLDKTVLLHWLNNEYSIAVRSPQQKFAEEMWGEEADEAGQGEVHAPMPGMILKIEVEPGQSVTVGEPLMVIEAMKMENEIRAAVDGTVEKIAVQPGQAVEKNDLLVTITP